CQHYYSSPSSF
nr:immunoglobulin light chain junction region [Macaca mulatta]MPN91307.1 immunoglobulin light chain junction region [Macaca mulatta]MPN91495.1 immunoglobulin light chain junction region [Macaca mulatta]MPN91511.1 immunoglobulin light chain junction region [Macaca mulatta]MPN91722.1 immunoglobulin light chain junction region [Macaca mulatta]